MLRRARTGRRAAISTLAAIAALAVGAGPAGAITVDIDGTTLVLRPDAGEIYNGQVSDGVDGTPYVQVSTSGDTLNLLDGRCVPSPGGSTTFAQCRIDATANAGFTKVDMEGSEQGDSIIVDVPFPSSLLGHGGVDSLSSFDGSLGEDYIDGGGGNDTYLAGGLGADEVWGGTGNDGQLSGGPGTDYVDGEAGNDYVLGGDGDDEVRGGTGTDDVRGDNLIDDETRDGDDDVFGGDGNDELHGSFGADVFSGGSGTDTVSYDERNESDYGLEVTLDNVQNDGASDSDGNIDEQIDGSGKADLVGVGGDVENVTGPFGSSTDLDTVMVGNGAANVFTSETLHGTARLAGGGGNDILNARFADAAVILGGEGNDTAYGTSSNDLIRGEGGNDILDGEGGNDRVEAGTGIDVLFGGGGSDTLITNQDRAAGDRANCEDGADVAQIDAGDLTDLLCENLTTTPLPIVISPLPPIPVVDLAVPKTLKLVNLLKGLDLTADRPGTFATTFMVAAKDAKKFKLAARKPVVIAKGKATLRAAGTVKLKPKLTKKAKKRLKKVKKIKVTATTTFTATDGKKKVVKDRFTLKRK